MRVVVGLIGVLSFVGVVLFLWMARLPPFHGHPAPVVSTVPELRVDLDVAQVSGTAHLPLRATQQRSPGLGRAPVTHWVMPLFPRGDTSSRSIHAVLVTPVAPEPLSAFEDRTVVAWVLPPAAAMTTGLERAFGEAGYTFTDDYVVLEEIPDP